MADKITQEFANVQVTVTNSSQDILTLTSWSALEDNCIGIGVVNTGGASVFYEVDGTAAVAATNAEIPNNATHQWTGRGDKLKDLAFIVASGTNVLSVIQYVEL